MRSSGRSSPLDCEMEKPLKDLSSSSWSATEGSETMDVLLPSPPERDARKYIESLDADFLSGNGFSLEHACGLL